MYVVPVTKIHSTFDEAKEFLDKFSGIIPFEDEKRLDISDLAQGNRNLIVGEPGIGKTLLLGKIKDQLDRRGFVTAIIGLRQANVINQIDNFLVTKAEDRKVLLLDALDEVQSNFFPAVLQKIEDVSLKYPNLPIYLSARWIFILRYAKSFPGYRFITISPFTSGQVKEYLLGAGHSEIDIEALLHRIISFGHRMLILQIPRYLYYLEDFLSTKGVSAATQVSRNELFEYFIYSKLELEEKKLNTNHRTIMKRVLEKLALTMEIYQTNVLSKDELMTFFDDLKSDLKLAALSQISLETFYEYSLLKNNIDTVEFENTEFQEYLAAKEITRFSNPSRAAFSFSVDVDAKEIYPTWFNALTFLVDMQKDLLEQLVEFSGIRGTDFKIVDEGFLNFLSRIHPQNISQELQQKLFIDVIAYHTRTRQWLPGQLTSALPALFHGVLEANLKSWVAETEQQSESKRYVPLGNIAYVVGYLFRQGIVLDKNYWKEKLILWTADKNENGVLQRHALFALEQLGDPTTIDSLPNLMDKDQLVVREFLSVCATLDPENSKSLEYFFEAVRNNNFYGRYGLLEIKRPESIKKFLKTFNEDVNFRRQFLDDTSLFKDKDAVFAEHIEAVLDSEITELCKEALVLSLHYNFAHIAENSAFILGLWQLLKKKDPGGFISEMIERIRTSPIGKTGLYFADGFFAAVIEKQDVLPYLDAIIKAGERNSAFSVMVKIKFSKKALADEIFEAGRPKLPEEYKEWEERNSKSDRSLIDENKKLVDEFKILLEPEPGKFSNNVFEFYDRHAQQIDSLLTDEDRNRLRELLTGTIFKFIDPIKHELVITDEHEGSRSYKTSSSIYIFGDALKVAKRLGLDATAFRQPILNYIPFAYNEQLKIIFELVKDINPQEMAAVLEVYKSRKSDLWRHQTTSFIDAVEQYHIVEAAPILKDFVKEPKCDKYSRERAITVLDSLASDPLFLKEIFEAYQGSENVDEIKLAHLANGLLIVPHTNGDAIRWRLNQIVTRAAAFICPQGIHGVGRLEDEITHSKAFAKPLMDLKRSGYAKDYLELLDEAMKIYARGKEFYAYAEYLWDIVYAHFDNLKEDGSYLPLRQLENKIAEMKDRNGTNWLASRMVNLRRSYLGYLGKPRNVSEAVKKYNDTRNDDDKKILNSSDLFRHLQDALDTDLRRWIEGEGAYDIILGPKVYASKRQEYEKLIQKTIKTQIENIFLKRGFHVDVLREPQLYDEKRIDFLVRYGFVGPIVIEVKLSSNNDIKRGKIEQSASYVSMGRYMEGFGASHGIFLIIDNLKAKNLPQIKEIFQKIKNVWVQSFDCFKGKTATRQSKKKKVKTRKTKITSSRRISRPRIRR